MPETVEGEVSARGFRFAIIVSRYNSFITDQLLTEALEALKTAGASETDITVFRVPGSFELPQAAGKILQFERYDAVICLGALLRGETLHFELISNECARGLQSVARQFGVPVTFGVITANTVEQAQQRAGVKSENKGWEAAMSAVEMVNLYKHISDRSG
jgi:6,7-dimethyl-8-ribityllumazine synthase